MNGEYSLVGIELSHRPFRYLLFDVENVVATSGDHEMLIEGCLRRPVQPLAHSGGLFWLDFFFLLRLFL